MKETSHENKMAEEEEKKSKKMTEVEELLLETGRELHRSASQMQPFIDKLVNENWLDTAQSLRDLSSDQWRQLQLPLRLEELLKGKLHVKSSSSPPPPSSSSSGPSVSLAGHVLPQSPPSPSLSSSPATHPPEKTSLGVDGPGENEEKKKKIKTPSFSSSSSSEGKTRDAQEGGEKRQKGENVVDEEDFSICYAAVDESLFPHSLSTSIERLQLEIPSESLPSAVRTLAQVVDGVLSKPNDPKRRRLRKTNATFHQNVGQYRAAVRVMEALGFIEAKMHTYSNKKNYKKKDENAPGDQTGEAGGGGGGEEGELDDFYVMTDAYILRLTDAHYLLAELGRHVGLSIPSLPPSSGGFNPYTSSIVSSSGTSFKEIAGQAHAETRLAETGQIKEKIKHTQILLQTGGGKEEEVDLAPAVYALEELRYREKLAREEEEKQRRLNGAEEDEDSASPSRAPALTAADVARIKEIMSEGPSFKSRLKQQLEQLQKRKVYRSCIVRILLPDRLILQLTFAPSKTLKYVRGEVQKFLHPDLRSLPPSSSSPSTSSSDTSSSSSLHLQRKWYLCETPPLRKVDLTKTLYDHGFVPNCTLHLKFPEGCPPFSSSIPPFLDLQVLAHHSLALPRSSSLSPSSALSTSSPPPAPLAPRGFFSSSSSPSSSSQSNSLDLSTAAMARPSSSSSSSSSSSLVSGAPAGYLVNPSSSSSSSSLLPNRHVCNTPLTTTTTYYPTSSYSPSSSSVSPSHHSQAHPQNSSSSSSTTKGAGNSQNGSTSSSASSLSKKASIVKNLFKKK